MKTSLDQERMKMKSRISLLNTTNLHLSAKLKEIEDDTDINNTKSIISKLDYSLANAKKMLKDEKEDRNIVGFKLNTLLEVANDEIAVKNKELAKKTEDYNLLMGMNNDALKELNNIKIVLKANRENIEMQNEDMIQLNIKMRSLKNKLSEQYKDIEALKQIQQELETEFKLQKEGLSLNKKVSMEGTLFYFLNGESISHLNNETKLSSKNVNENTETNLPNDKSQNEVNLDAIDIWKYSYMKPTYRALVDELFFQNNSTINYEPPFQIGRAHV